MQKKSIHLLLLAALAAILLSSCNLISIEPEDTVDSHLISTEDTPEINSATVGIVWDKMGAKTNLTRIFADSIDGDRILDPSIVKVNDLYHIWYTAVIKVRDIERFAIKHSVSKDGITWYNQGPSSTVISPSRDPSSLDYEAVRLGTVIWDKEDEEFKMWYRGKDSSNQWRYFYAFSKTADSGWVKYPEGAVKPEPIFEKSAAADYPFDSDGLGDFTITKELHYDGISYYPLYRMHYVGKGTSDPGIFPLQNRIHYASSPLGITDWQKGSAPVLADDKTFGASGRDMPAVLRDIKGGSWIYKLWFVGTEMVDHDADPSTPAVATNGMGHAYSPTGKKFKYFMTPTVVPAVFDPVIKLNEVVPPGVTIKDQCIIRDGYVYKMWYVCEESDGAGNVLDSYLYYVESW